MATQLNVVNDLGTLLRIPNKVMSELSSKECLCIGSIIHEASKAGEQVVVINIGIGTLSVNLVDMQCKFVPGKELKNAIKRSLTSEIDPLELVLEQALSEKLIAACEEVL
jgi:hypothetical protein